MSPKTATTPKTSLNDPKYWIGFSRVPGLGAVRFQALLDRFGTLASAWAASRSELKEAGLSDSVIRAIVQERDTADLDREMDRLADLSVRALTWNDPSYPELLKAIDDSPPVLYVRGEILPADGLSVAVVGTRKPTPYGRQVAEEMSHQLAVSGVTVVSGLARGVDGIAHRAALAAGGRTLAVMACGLDMVYPPEHARLATEIIENGAVISEQPLGAQPRGDFFPRRNRILSGLSLGTLVIEGDQKSGALITADCANDQGRDVFAVPGSIFSPQSRGPNLKIQRSEAKLVIKVADILEELNLQAIPQQMEMQEMIPATDTEAELLRHMSKEPAHIDDLCRESGLPVSAVSGLLTMMELRGLIKEVGAKAYVTSRSTVAHGG
ncbi:MAG: DNA-processing protein DprA [Dehalococcoidia bacterium]